MECRGRDNVRFSITITDGAEDRISNDGITILRTGIEQRSGDIHRKRLIVALATLINQQSQTGDHSADYLNSAAADCIIPSMKA